MNQQTKQAIIAQCKSLLNNNKDKREFCKKVLHFKAIITDLTTSIIPYNGYNEFLANKLISSYINNYFGFELIKVKANALIIRNLEDKNTLYQLCLF